MEFQKQEISIQTHTGPQVIPAIVGVGTGLAYHKFVSIDGSFGNWYVLTHVPSGYNFSSAPASTHWEAQAWLSAVAALDEDQFNLSQEALSERYDTPEKMHALRAKIEMAHFNALSGDNQAEMAKEARW